MEKTNEFRIRESKGKFTVERKCLCFKIIPFIDGCMIENWHTYFKRNGLDTKAFIVNNLEDEFIIVEKIPILAFYSLDSAKEFIKNELAFEQETKTKESVIYHVYP